MDIHVCRATPAKSDCVSNLAPVNVLSEPSVEQPPAQAQQLPAPHRLSLASHQDAVCLGKGDTTDGSVSDSPQGNVGNQRQGRDMGSSRGNVAAGGRWVDTSRRPVDERARRLGTQRSVLAEAGGGPLEPGRGHFQKGRTGWTVAQTTLSLPRDGGRLWRSESDLLQSESAATEPHPQLRFVDASPPAFSRSSSDADSHSGDTGRQQWRSESHLSARPSTTLSQMHRSQPCLLSSRPDYSGVSSRVAAYIERRRQQDREYRARRRASRSQEPSLTLQERAASAETLDCETLSAKLDQERAERMERERQLEQLQTNYDLLVTKYAEAETYIDRMRFKSSSDLSTNKSQDVGTLSLYPGRFRPCDQSTPQVATGLFSVCERPVSDFSRSLPFLRPGGARGSLLRRNRSEASNIGISAQTNEDVLLKEACSLPSPEDTCAGPGGVSWRAQRWDICRPLPARTVSCERAVQTDTPPPPVRSVSTLEQSQRSSDPQLRAGDVGARWDRANQLARQVNLRSRCILDGVTRSTAC